MITLLRFLRRLQARVVLTICLILSICVVLPAGAAPKDAGKEVADQAAEKFKEGKFLEAGELFERAFALNPKMLVRLRNAGRAFEEAGRLEYARVIFQRYLDQAPDSEEKQEVQARMVKISVKLKGNIEEKQAQTPKVEQQLHSDAKGAAGPASAHAGEPGAPATGDTTEKAAPANPKTQPAESVEASSSANSRLSEWLGAGAGAAIAVTGAVWLAKTFAAATAVDKDYQAGNYAYGPDGDAKYTAAQSTLSTNKIVGASLLGAGTVATGVFVYLALRNPEKAAKVDLTPEIAPNLLALSLAWRF